jgi:hypothetical protein
MNTSEVSEKLHGAHMVLQGVYIDALTVACNAVTVTGMDAQEARRALGVASKLLTALGKVAAVDAAMKENTAEREREQERVAQRAVWRARKEANW